MGVKNGKLFHSVLRVLVQIHVFHDYFLAAKELRILS